nr:MAG TPA: hypothetical protein [Caudoviricetes sp.]
MPQTRYGAGPPAEDQPTTRGTPIIAGAALHCKEENRNEKHCNERIHDPRY